MRKPGCKHGKGAHPHCHFNLNDDLSYDAQGEFLEYQKCGQEPQGLVCHMGDQLANQAFYHVWCCMAILLRHI